MPTRSRPGLSRAALACFLAQTYETRELVILDDEDDPSFVDAPSAPGVLYLRGPRLRLGTKRNALCEAARGHIIIHWDSDDWSHPDRMMDQVWRLGTSDQAMTGYHSLLFWDERNACGYRWTGAVGYACGASLCYLKEFWAAHRFPDVDVAEDNALVEKARISGGVVTVDARGKLVARVHGANTSSAQRIGQNNWPLVSGSEFPAEFFKAIYR